jgi:hypothetical protein
MEENTILPLIFINCSLCWLLCHLTTDSYIGCFFMKMIMVYFKNFFIILIFSTKLLIIILFVFVFVRYIYIYIIIYF